MGFIESILSAIFGPRKGHYTAYPSGRNTVKVYEKGRKHPFVVSYHRDRDPSITHYDFPFIERNSRTYLRVLRAANEVR